MHDSAFEQKLRATVQAEGDAIVLTITAAELERRLALRHRGRSSTFASVALAAALGVALLGLAGVAGGWFEQRVVVPVPSASGAPISLQPTIESSIEPARTPVLLPSLEDLLAPLEPEAIIEAQTAGPASGVAPEGLDLGGPLGPGSTTLSQVADAGSYRLWIACLGESAMGVDVRRSVTSTEPFVPISVTCNSEVSVRQIGLYAGDRLLVALPARAAWRIILELPGRAAPHATSYGDLPIAGPDEEELARAESSRGVPGYDEPAGPAQPASSVGSLPGRDRMAVVLSCAGPSSLDWGIGNRVSGSNGMPDGATVTEVSGVIDCDGRVHRVDLDFVIASGGELSVSADVGTAWTVAVLGEHPPVALPENDGSWTMSSAIGPLLLLDGMPQNTSLIGADGGGGVQVVVSCEGDGPLSVAVDTGHVEGVTVDRFELQCESGSSMTVRKHYPDAAGQVSIAMDPGGKRMWLVATVRVRPGG